MIPEKRSAWRRAAKILVYGVAAKFALFGAAYWLAMDMLRGLPPA